MKGRVLGFAGAIGSGKSTISKRISEYLNLPIVSFGNYVRSVALQKGLDSESRQVLQSVGESIIKEKGWLKFCEEVISQANWEPGESLIIDGIRHEKAVQNLKKVVLPSKFYLIYINIDNTEQRARLKEKGESVELLDLFEANSTEVEVKSNLPGFADFNVDGGQPIDKMIAGILAWLRNID